MIQKDARPNFLVQASLIVAGFLVICGCGNQYNVQSKYIEESNECWFDDAANGDRAIFTMRVGKCQPVVQDEFGNVANKGQPLREFDVVRCESQTDSFEMERRGEFQLSEGPACVVSGRQEASYRFYTGTTEVSLGITRGEDADESRHDLTCSPMRSTELTRDVACLD